jgi:hypothetical protein
VGAVVLHTTQEEFDPLTRHFTTHGTNMRWRPKKITIGSNEGNTRIVKRFAFVPVWLSTKEYVWLQSYYVVEELWHIRSTVEYYYEHWRDVARFPDMQSVVDSKYY